MRKLIEDIQSRIQAFVEQRDDLILLVGCTDNDAPMVLKLVEDVEQATGTDVFLLFADNFEDRSSFTSATIERLRRQHKAACEWLEEQGEPTLPPVPAELDDPTLSPGERLRQAMSYSRSLVPMSDGAKVVWAMVPQAIEDRWKYLDFVSEFVPKHGLEPWMRGLRLIFRDEPETEELVPAYGQAPRVRLDTVDMGPDAIQKALQEEVEDEERSDDERMQALLQNALLDSAHGRYDDASAQFQVLLGYYQHTENHVLQALVLNSIGDVYRRLQNPGKANFYYECAVPPATESESAVMLHTAVRNLADLAFEARQYERAAELYKAADQLAAKMLYPEGKAHALERQGLSQEGMGAVKDAVTTWETAAEFCHRIELQDNLKANLEHLVRGYQHLGMPKKLKAAKADLRAMQLGMEGKT